MRTPVPVTRMPGQDLVQVPVMQQQIITIMHKQSKRMMIKKMVKEAVLEVPVQALEKAVAPPFKIDGRRSRC